MSWWIKRFPSYRDSRSVARPCFRAARPRPRAYERVTGRALHATIARVGMHAGNRKRSNERLVIRHSRR
jgi:hypothetical protein